ncbi:DinB family protein [Heyndrickxia acidicola]|uniref:DinB family protein n=1 Tax=Heyndrickxia acidicola TaxID=209389 RepID=A0ABU6MFV2_9BACI|nr:DinB family protein [Heyndrickxia acidicola]MED1203551.1 DinB family protein [Heyndrickxia acidicola]
MGHEAHHKGQLVLYARMLGVIPPFYIDLRHAALVL